MSFAHPNYERATTKTQMVRSAAMIRKAHIDFLLHVKERPQAGALLQCESDTGRKRGPSVKAYTKIRIPPDMAKFCQAFQKVYFPLYQQIRSFQPS